jgi:hypothetical protein
MPVPRIEQPIDPAGLVAEQEQTFGILIEAADREDPFGKSELRQGPLARLVRRELAKHAVGLVKGDQHGIDLPSK